MRSPARRPLDLLEVRLARARADSEESARRRLIIQYAATRVLAQAPNLGEAMPGILEALCRNADWDVGELWVGQEDERALRRISSWSDGSAEIAAFDRAMQGFTFGYGHGLAGRAWALGKPVWQREILEDSALLPAEALTEAGLDCALAYPVTMRDRVVAVLQFFGREGRDPDQGVFQMLGSTSILVSQFLERRRAEELIRENEAQIAYLACHDRLTGLPNRAMFEELLELAVSRAQRHGAATAVLCMDIDDMKLVNDSLGHASGDELLKQVADRVQKVCRVEDTVARLGGDEFLVLLSDIELSDPVPDRAAPNTPEAVAEGVANRIEEALRLPFRLDGVEFFVSASIGISLFPFDASDVQTLLRDADAAMRRSKKGGPGGHTMSNAQATDPGRRLSLATRLRKAVEERPWVLHYQPIVELERGRVVGAEALLRWRDLDHGLIGPNEFVPLAEEMGLITVIGAWVIDELLRQHAVWRRQGLDLDVSFNLSPRQLWHPDFAEAFIGKLADPAVDPSRVLVEVTETTAMTDPGRTQQAMDVLRKRGIRFAIDDFGTGYSSLSRLKDLPVDVLKIDRSFVEGLPEDQHAGAVVRAIIQLAESLGMSALAEGIETEPQRRFLLDHQCRRGQGFLFSRPVPAERIAELAAGKVSLPRSA